VKQSAKALRIVLKKVIVYLLYKGSTSLILVASLTNLLVGVNNVSFKMHKSL